MIDQKNNDIVAKILIDIGSVKFSFNKPFILTSGLKSPVYVDCRKIISYVNERNTIIEYTKKYFKEKKIEFDILAGGETAGIPYAAYLSEHLQKPMIYVRKKPKGFGKNQQIEGNIIENKKTILIEDLATDGGSKVIFIEAMRKAGLIVNDIFVIFYYDIFNLQDSPLSSFNVKIHSLCTWKNILNILIINKLYSNNEIKILEKFLEDPDKWRSTNE